MDALGLTDWINYGFAGLILGALFFLILRFYPRQLAERKCEREGREKAEAARLDAVTRLAGEFGREFLAAMRAGSAAAEKQAASIDRLTEHLARQDQHLNAQVDGIQRAIRILSQDVRGLTTRLPGTDAA